MSPAPRSTGATCRGRPHHRCPVAFKCRRRADRGRRGATRLWARAHVRRLTRVGQRSARSRTASRADPPRRSEERSVSVCQLYDGSDRPDSDSLQRRWSQGRSSDSASTPSAPQAAEWSATLRHLQSLLIQGGGAPDVHVSLVAGEGHGPTLAVVEAGGSASEQMGRMLTPWRRRVEAKQLPRRRAPSAQPSSRWARSVQPPSRGCQVAWLRKPGCAPRCKLPTSAFVCHESSDLLVYVGTCLLVDMLTPTCLAWGI
jgi:hypothetical protein